MLHDEVILIKEILRQALHDHNIYPLDLSVMPETAPTSGSKENGEITTGSVKIKQDLHDIFMQANLGCCRPADLPRAAKCMSSASSVSEIGCCRWSDRTETLGELDNGPGCITSSLPGSIFGFLVSS